MMRGRLKLRAVRHAAVSGSFLESMSQLAADQLTCPAPEGRKDQTKVTSVAFPVQPLR